MTSCQDYQVAIVALFDDEAQDQDLQLVAGHLQNCPDCRAFWLDTVGLRRAMTSASVPGLSPAGRQEVLDGIGAHQSHQRESGAHGKALWPRLGRWAAVVAIAALSAACVSLATTANDLKARLEGAQQEVAAIRTQEQQAEAEERQRKAISALYFRMAELEERVDRFSGPQRARFAERPYGLPEQQNGL